MKNLLSSEESAAAAASSSSATAVFLIGLLFSSLVSIGDCWTMMPRTIAMPSSSSLLYASTIEQQETTSSSSSAVFSVQPPPSVDDMMKENDATISSYDQHVQNTYGRFPLTIKSGSGCYLTSNDDVEYLDFVSGIATCGMGHGNTALRNAINEQMKLVNHVSNLYYIPQQAALAKWLTMNTFGHHQEEGDGDGSRAFFCNSGAEANEAAIKCMRKYANTKTKKKTTGATTTATTTTKPIIITAINSFHGRTLGSLSATGQPKYHNGFTYDNEMMPGFKYVPYNDIQALEDAVSNIDTEGDTEILAGIMMEALQGEGGIIPGTNEYFTKARELCDQHDAMLAFDEVQVGIGRTGTLWGHQNLINMNTGKPIIPDIVTSAKALGGGIPIGAMIASGNKAANVFQPGDHASTYGGNPLACSAGLCVAHFISQPDTLVNVKERGQQLRDGLEQIASDYPSILGQVRGWGLIQGIEFIVDSTTTEIMDNNITVGRFICDYVMSKQQLLLVGAGSNVIRFVPPLIVTSKEIDDALMKFRTAIDLLYNDIQQQQQ